MRVTFCIAVCLLTGAAAAAPVTVDFAEVTPFTSTTDFSVDSKGYNFQTSGLKEIIDGGVDLDGLYLDSFVPSGPGSQGFGDSSITMTASNGGTFAILNLDASGTGSFQGQVGGSEFWSLLTDPVGTGDWLNLTAFAYRDDAVSFELMELRIDSVVVRAVPVPAALWLFASALAALGWGRSRRRG